MRPKPKSPEDALRTVLRRSKKALAAFEAMPPSHRKRWMAYLAEPKGAEARARRSERCVRELSAAREPGSSTGYSGTPLVRKLGVKEGHRVALLAAPAKLPAGLVALPAGVSAETRLGTDAVDVVVLFAHTRAHLARLSGKLRANSHPMAACGSRGRSAPRASRPT